MRLLMVQISGKWIDPKVFKNKGEVKKGAACDGSQQLWERAARISCILRIELMLQKGEQVYNCVKKMGNKTGTEACNEDIS